METDIQKSLLTSPLFDGVWNGAAQDGRREKGKKRMGAFPGASRPVPRLQEGCPCCVQERNVLYYFVHDAYDPFARHNAVETTEPVFKILFDGFVSVNGREPVKSGNRTLTNEAMMQDMFPRKGK